MGVTEYERHQLFVWFEEQMGPERAATMMNLIPPVGWFQLASKHDLLELEGRLDGRLAQVESRVTRSLVTWLLASQATVVAAVGLMISLS
jgi:hypothetical protein